MGSDGTSKEDRPESVSKGANKAYRILESQGFIVGRTLGSGSYARVKCAYDMNRKHKVAVKIINKQKSFDEYLNKFLPREVEAMRILTNHYSIVKFYQIIETTSRYFFIMEYAEKGDLLNEVKARGTIPENQAGRWFINMFDGVKYMHGKGVVHRDIKCENLVIDAHYTLKLTDLGFAKKIGKNKSGDSLLSETYCGSYAYAPPEILKGIPYNPELSDVWSMGVVLYTMLYGRLPFDDGDHKKLLKQVQSRIVFPNKPVVSSDCKLFILKIFLKVPERVLLKHMKLDAWFKFQQIVCKQGKEEKANAANEVTATSDEDVTRPAGTDNSGETTHHRLSMKLVKEKDDGNDEIETTPTVHDIAKETMEINVPILTSEQPTVHPVSG
ncbi:testis-specific serine/threonine-protein kinase 4-like [Dreissena polymorpha]|uniref:Protein kinase domain-containing protein n=1 Tax=Dreissena polymorpha TaxID=45954 RepID=A0A9D4BEP3_DREPO|nr:testis-specific serine/threonine-protein kinase 4-like [Dreissena polymorpha]KAH3692543.1 hypothetical protein DPMN_193092 [Dreissena polymorpha]